MILFPIVAACFLTFGLLYLGGRLAQRSRFLPIALVISFAAALASAPSLWMAIANGYPHDSFFDLSFFGRSGVLLIGLVLIVSFMGLISWKSQRLLSMADHKGLLHKSMTGRCLLLLVDFGIGVAMFGVLHALTPQAYYQFYHLIYPGLPHQIVIKTLFDYEGIGRFALLAANGNLSQHLSGLVLIAIVPMTALAHIKYGKFAAKAAFPIIGFTATTMLLVNIFRHF